MKMPRFCVEQRALPDEVKELLDMPGPVYVVMDQKTGRSVAFGGYGEDWKRAQARADRENEKHRTDEDE